MYKKRQANKLGKPNAADVCMRVRVSIRNDFSSPRGTVSGCYIRVKQSELYPREKVGIKSQIRSKGKGKSNFNVE